VTSSEARLEITGAGFHRLGVLPIAQQGVEVTLRTERKVTDAISTINKVIWQKAESLSQVHPTRLCICQVAAYV